MKMIKEECERCNVVAELQGYHYPEKLALCIDCVNFYEGGLDNLPIEEPQPEPLWWSDGLDLDEIDDEGPSDEMRKRAREIASGYSGHQDLVNAADLIEGIVMDLGLSFSGESIEDRYEVAREAVEDILWA